MFLPLISNLRGGGADQARSYYTKFTIYMLFHSGEALWLFAFRYDETALRYFEMFRNAQLLNSNSGRKLILKKKSGNAQLRFTIFAHGFFL